LYRNHLFYSTVCCFDPLARGETGPEYRNAYTIGTSGTPLGDAPSRPTGHGLLQHAQAPRNRLEGASRVTVFGE
jgi:hypothetical protein